MAMCWYISISLVSCMVGSVASMLSCFGSGSGSASDVVMRNLDIGKYRYA
jgi:hypothetical protein